MVSRRAFLNTMVAGGTGMALVGRGTSVAAQGGGYWLPDEADAHVRTFMQWPVNRTIHPDAAFLEDLQDAIARVANTIVEFEPVVMLMNSSVRAAARRKLAKAIEIWPVPTDDLWCRDSGPLFVRNEAGDLAVADLNFNGWGGKQVHTHDARIARAVAKRMNIPVFDSGVVGEAGGVESDGHGTLMAHESSWVNTNRNRLSKEQVEARLLRALGAEKMIWAPGVKSADITDYHIDSLARFTAPGHVIIQLPDQVDPSDPWSRSAIETHDILAVSHDARGRRLSMQIVPEPYRTRVRSDDFVASYVNYYVCNGGVIAAEFGDRETDMEAARALARAYPGREVVMLNVDAIGEVGGGIHCATQQQPAD